MGMIKEFSIKLGKKVPTVPNQNGLSFSPIICLLPVKNELRGERKFVVNVT